MKTDLERRLEAARVIAAVEAHQDAFKSLSSAAGELEGRATHYAKIIRGDTSDSEIRAREKLEESLRKLSAATSGYQDQQEEILKILSTKSKTEP